MGLLGVSDFGTRKIQDHFWMDFVDVLGLWVDVLGCYPCFLRIGMIWDVIHVFWGLAWFGMLSMFSEDWHDLGCYPCFLRIGMIWDVIHVFWGLAWFGMLSMFSEDWHDLGCYPCFLRIGMIWDVIHVFWGLAWFGMLSMFSEDWHDLGCYPCFLRIGMIWDVIHVFWGLAWFCDFVTKSWSGMVADLAEIRVFSCSSLQREVKYPPRIRVFVVLHWVVPYLTLICGILGLGTSAVRDCVDGKFWDFLEYFGISWNILGFLGIRGCWDVEFHI